MKRRTLIVQGQGMAGTLYFFVELAIRQFQWPNPFADTACHLIDGQAVCCNRIPQSEEFDRANRSSALMVGNRTEPASEQFRNVMPNKLIGKLQDRKRTALGTISAVCRFGSLIELFFCIKSHQALIGNQSHHHAYRESTSAKSKAETFFACSI